MKPCETLLNPAAITLASDGQKTEIYDAFNRPLRALRISVTDRCNFRCPTCMPKDSTAPFAFIKKTDYLSFSEITRLVKIFSSLGVEKIRLTGGEPLLRPRLWALIADIAKTPGILDIALTTNGMLLPAEAKNLKNAGLRRLTVSLDTLKEDTFYKLNGGLKNLRDVLAGIEQAKNSGFAPIKINAVIRRNINEDAILPLVEFARCQKLILRFIEYMDVGSRNHWRYSQVIPSQKILELIQKNFLVQPASPNNYGETASRYLFVDGGGEIGFISSVTKAFCRACTRLRLSADGKLYTCLFAGEGTDLRAPLRNGASDEDVREIIRNVWEKRADKYSENRSLFQDLEGKIKKIEMYQIGG